MIVILGFLIFLLSLYLSAREDFILVRRNLSTEQIFDIAFIAALASLLFARVTFVALHFSSAYFNPLIFFLIPYFPGLSVSGAILGSFFFLLWVARNRKLPTAHILDLFSISFFYAFSTALFGYSILSLLHKQFIAGTVEVVWSIIGFALSILLGSILMKSLWKDGSMSIVVVLCISSVLLISRGVIMVLQKPFVLDKELIIIVFIFIVAGVMGIGKRFMKRGNI